MDTLTPARRSANMSRIRANGSAPEMLVRRTAHAMGFRFRLHRKDLPGKPDLVFPRLRKIVFVHGCFWHQHPGCREGRTPSSNQGYWAPKLARNVERDRIAQESLRRAGWDVVTLWECECRTADQVRAALRPFLNSVT